MHFVAIGLYITGFLLAAVTLIFFGPLWFTPTDGSYSVDQVIRARGDVRAALLQLFVGFAVVVGVWFTARTYRLTRRVQRTDRFMKAVDALGSTSEAVRAGGVYVLWMLVSESAAYWQVVEQLLSDFVREQATSDTVLGTDVQAALTVIGRRPLRSIAVNLRNSKLPAAELSGANLELAILDGAHLQNAYLNDAKLENATLKGATLPRAALRGADLRGTSFRNADLNDADFYMAKADRTDVRDVNVSQIKNLRSIVNYPRGLIMSPPGELSTPDSEASITQ